MSDEEKIAALEKRVEQLQNMLGDTYDMLEFYREFYNKHRFCKNEDGGTDALV